jgi:hypothetical protein
LKIISVVGDKHLDIGCGGGPYTTTFVQFGLCELEEEEKERGRLHFFCQSQTHSILHHVVATPPDPLYY